MYTRTCAVTATLGALVLAHDDRSNYKAIILNFFYLFGAQTLLLLSYSIFIYPIFLSPLRRLPGPKNENFFFGQTLNFIRAEGANDLPLQFMRANPSAPLIRYLHIANSEWVLLNSVQACREVFQTKCYEFRKPEYFRRVIGELAGIGLVNSEGDKHKQQRRLLNGPLSIVNVRKIVPVFNEKAAALASRISEEINDAPDAPLDVSETFARTTLDVIGRASLGVELGSLSVQGSTFSALYQRILHQPPMGQLISVINMFIPCRSWLPLKANRDFLRATGEVRQLLRELIRERRKEIFGNSDGKTKIRQEFTEEGSRDLLTFMLYERSEGENKWSEDDVLGHLLNFMSAGHDTTAGALTWAAATLCLQPDIQVRLREEILSNLPSDRPPTHAELDSLSYMSLFLKEVLRCFSPTTLVPRTPIHDTTICGNVIPAGTTCLMNPQTLQFNPAIWGPDAETFDVERHSPDHWTAKEFPDSRDPYAIAAFSNGPRICIGKAFATLEFKSILSQVLRNFELVRGWDEEGKKLPDGEEFKGKYEKKGDVFGGIKVVNFVTLRPREGVWVHFKPLAS